MDVFGRVSEAVMSDSAHLATHKSHLLLHSHAQGDVSSSDMVAGITVYTSQLEDFR